jgi:hypothetical protein
MDYRVAGLVMPISRALIVPCTLLLSGCSKSPPAAYDALLAKYLPEARIVAANNVARCQTESANQGAHPAKDTPLSSDRSVVDVTAGCWGRSDGKATMHFMLGKDSSLRSLPLDIPRGSFKKKRYMLHGQAYDAVDAEWLDVPDGEPSSKVVEISVNRPAGAGWIGVTIELRAP